MRASVENVLIIEKTKDKYYVGNIVEIETYANTYTGRISDITKDAYDSIGCHYNIGLTIDCSEKYNYKSTTLNCSDITKIKKIGV